MIWVAGLAGAAAVGLAGAYFFVPHVARRIKRFMDPSSGDTFNIDQAMESFLRGGWFGRGPGEGTVKRILPDSHADFVFAVAAEEFGIVLCLVLVALFAFIVMRALRHAIAQRGSVHALRGGRPRDPVRHAVGHQHGGELASDAGQGHDAAVHLLWRLVDDLARLRHGHAARVDARAAARRNAGEPRELAGRGARPDGRRSAARRSCCSRPAGPADICFPAEALAAALGTARHRVDLATDARAERYGTQFPARQIHVIPSETVRGRDPMSLARTAALLGLGAVKALLPARPHQAGGGGRLRRLSDRAAAAGRDAAQNSDADP